MNHIEGELTMKTGKILLITCLLCAVMALTAVFGAVAEEQQINTCGENLTWKIEGDTLIISGTGPMDNYTYGPMPSEDGEGTVTACTAPWYGNRDFTKIIVEEDVTTLGDCAFFNNTNIHSVSLPETLVSIRGYVFHSDSNLQDINLPDSITSIGLCAFTGCDSLKNIRLPASLTTIQSAVFNSCYQLLQLRIPDAVTAIQGSPFAYCKSLETIAVPASVTEIDSRAFDNCPALKNILVVTGSYAEQFCIDNNLPYTAMDVLPE